jgi:hypothetical protein
MASKPDTAVLPRSNPVKKSNRIVAAVGVFVTSTFNHRGIPTQHISDYRQRTTQRDEGNGRPHCKWFW